MEDIVNKERGVSKCLEGTLGMLRVSRDCCSQRTSPVTRMGCGRGVFTIRHTFLYLVTRTSVENWEVWNACPHLCGFSKLAGKTEFICVALTGY